MTEDNEQITVEYPVKHLKMMSGEEIVCELVSELMNKDGHPIELVCRRIIQVDQVTMQEGGRTYIMKPWMIFQDNIHQYTTLNPTHLMAVVNPNNSLLEQYYTTLIAITQVHHARTSEQATDEDIVDLKETLITIDANYAGPYMGDDYEEYYKDSDETNVYHLHPKPLLH